MRNRAAHSRTSRKDIQMNLDLITKISRASSGAAMIALLLSTTMPDSVSAQIVYDGVEYGSMSEALTAVTGTIEPSWFTPERKEALGDVLAEVAATQLAKLVSFAVTSRAPGGIIGGEIAGAAINDQIEWYTRAGIQYLRDRPDTRPRLEQIMEQAQVSYTDVNPEPYLGRGAIGYFEYQKAFLEHVRDQLTLREASVKGASTLPNSWLVFEIMKADDALADLRTLDGIQVQPEEDDISGLVNAKILEAVTYACDSPNGKMSDGSVFIQDLDGDGKKDLILDHAGISCTASMNISCGAQVCTTQLFLFRNGDLENVQEILNTVTGVSSDPVPEISIYGHGGTQGKIKWNGKQFSR